MYKYLSSLGFNWNPTAERFIYQDTVQFKVSREGKNKTRERNLDKFKPEYNKETPRDIIIEKTLEK